MEKLIALIEKGKPFFNAIARNKYLKAIRDGFISVMPIIIVSSIFLLVSAVPNVWGFYWPAEINDVLMKAYNYSMGIVGICAAATTAKHFCDAQNRDLPKNNQINFISVMIASLIGFLLLSSDAISFTDNGVSISGLANGYMGSKGLLTAFICAFATGIIYKFFIKRNITIKMPDGVPPFLSETFGAIVPMLANILIFFGGNLLIQMIDPALSIPSVIEKLLAAPLSVAVDSVPGALLICFMTLLFWCFGVHGNMIAMPITAPVTLAAFAANASLYAAGQPLEFHPVLMSLAINLIGGTGNTFSFVALCAFRAKSQQLKAFGRASIVPSFFRISEPAIFGAPIIFNPILMIPFVLGGMISALLYWGAVSLGLVSNFYILVSGTFPIFVQGFVQCLDPRIWVFTIVLIVVMAVVWYPFFKVYDNQLLAQEQENAAAASAEDTE